MTKLEIDQKISEGFRPVVGLYPNKKYDKVTLKTYLQSDTTNVVHAVYYNHIKRHLTSSQLENIELYHEVKTYQFRDKVDLHMTFRQNKATDMQVRKITMLQCIGTPIKFTEL